MIDDLSSQIPDYKFFGTKKNWSHLAVMVEKDSRPGEWDSRADES